jgi:hypothetical protein
MLPFNEGLKMQQFENVLSDEQIGKLNNFIDQHYSYDKFMFVFPNKNPEFKAFLIQNISPQLKTFINDESYITLRMVNNQSHGQEYQFHFDTYEETVLVPLIGSDSEFNGDLLINQNTRGNPSNIFAHVFGKLLYQNRVVLFFLKKMMNKFFKRISVKPGSIFQFNGAVCLHGNMPISGERRTVLIHNKKLFKDSKLTEAVEAFSQYRVAK